MSVKSFWVTTLAISLSLIGLTSCSPSTTVRAAGPEFYWSAARETYASGDYLKSIDHLERLIEADNEYSARAVPWYLVLTSGVAAGYMELADQYTAGARANKLHAAPFRVKAEEYRALASRRALQFAQNVDKIDRLPLGTMPLAFGLPKGNAELPSMLTAVAQGVSIAPADAETAEALTVQHYVLMTACLAVGSQNDVARGSEILGQPYPSISRATFAMAVAHILDSESALYSRDKLDDPEKLAAFRARAQRVQAEAAKVSSARVVDVGTIAKANH